MKFKAEVCTHVPPSSEPVTESDRFTGEKLFSGPEYRSADLIAQEQGILRFIAEG